MEVEGIYVLVSKVFIIINIATRSSVPITMKNSNTKKLRRENQPMMKYHQTFCKNEIAKILVNFLVVSTNLCIITTLVRERNVIALNSGSLKIVWKVWISWVHINIKIDQKLLVMIKRVQVYKSMQGLKCVFFYAIILIVRHLIVKLTDKSLIMCKLWCIVLKNEYTLEFHLIDQ